MPINESLHARAVRQVVAKEAIDVVLCGISHQAVGLPPRDLRVPLLFDYLDYKLENWPEVEGEYLARSDAVLCTSKVLLERVAHLHPHPHYLPNGVNLEAAVAADGERVREQYGLQGAKVVSLIGLTGSRELFFVDAIAAVAREIPQIAFLIVGDAAAAGGFGNEMIRRATALGLRTVATGQVAPSDVADFFAATDVGLYPGDKTPYFDAASPLKVLEYTAAGKPVVATDLAELRNWNFPNVHLAAPTEDAFAHEIKLALGRTHDFPDLSAFGWSALGERLESILKDVAGRKPS